MAIRPADHGVVAGQGGVTEPGAPGTLSLSAGTLGKSVIALSWAAPSDTGGGTIAGYRIKRGGSIIVADTGGTGTTYSNTGLTANTAYNFNVAAINEIGTGADGNTPSLTTLLGGGYVLGGADPALDRIEQYSFPGDVRSTLSATLGSGTTYFAGAGGANSGTAGYTGGGYTSGAVSTVNKMTFAAETMGTLARGLAQGATTALGAFANSGTAGYFAGGNAS